MSKLGISISIDVTKIDKSRIYEGTKGKYLKLTTFVDLDNPSQYGDHGFITQETTKEEREAELKLPIIGNSKVFYVDDSLKSGNTYSSQDTRSSSGQKSSDDFDDDIPF